MTLTGSIGTLAHVPTADPTSPFSLLTPLHAAATVVRARPAVSVLALLLFLIPLLPIAAGLQWVLRETASAALEAWIAGAPAGTPDALLTRPDTAGIGKLALAGLLIVAVVAALLAAGAAAVRAVQVDMRGAIVEWPVLLVGFLVQCLAGALLLTASFVLATLAGAIRFQLFDVVAFLGISLTLAATTRLGLWPSIAATGRVGLLQAMALSWSYTRRHNVRLLSSWAISTFALLVPALLLAAVARIGLTALERSEFIAWSPVTIDTVALLPLAATIPVGVLVCSAGICALHPVLEHAHTEDTRDRSELGDTAVAGV